MNEQTKKALKFWWGQRYVEHQLKLLLFADPKKLQMHNLSEGEIIFFNGGIQKRCEIIGSMAIYWAPQQRNRSIVGYQPYNKGSNDRY